MNKFRIKNKVYIKSSKKIDGRYNRWTILWIEFYENWSSLWYFSETQFLNRFTKVKYKVMYIDCFTQRACQEWFYEEDLQKDKP